MTVRLLSRTLSRAFALAGAIPLIAVSLLAITLEVPHFFDPCFTFGLTGGGMALTPPCRGHSGGTSGTIVGTILRLLLVPGNLLLAAVLALQGSYTRQRTLTFAGSLIVFLITL